MDEVQNKYSDISALTQQIARLTSNAQPVLHQINDVMKPIAILSENLSSITIPILPKIDFDRIDAIITPINNMAKTLQYFAESIAPIISPFYEWLKTFDFSSILSYDSERAERFKKENEFYMQSMYQAKWFPLVGWYSDICLFNEILSIFYSSKGISKRSINKIDKAVMKYYTDNEIRKIKKGWQKSNTDNVVKKIMNQAINAYFRKEYAVTSICLSTLWQNLIYQKIGDAVSGRKDKQTKEYYAKLIDENGYGEAFKSFFDDFIMYDCRSKEQALPDVPGRNSNAHGWHSEYPKKKAALNAIFLTDFILGLEEIKSEVA